MAANMTIEIPGLDVNSGLDLCDNDINIYLNSLRLYVSNVPAYLEKMKGVSEETLKNYYVAAHGVKSMSEYIGAEEVRKTAKHLEAIAKQGDLAGVLAQNETFIKHVENIVDNIQRWLENNKHILD